MRLLSTIDFKFQEFYADKTPTYAILSHRWQGSETTYQDFICEKSRPIRHCSPGVKKIIAFCETALEDGYKWAWIDTCCIDKTSSAELTEALNSMYSWYSKAGHCYAHLCDVEEGLSVRQTRKQFYQSEWFERGWTLQELIAPKRLIFFNRGWEYLGSRASLSSLVTDITSIREEVFGDSERISKTSIAERMSWMSRRKTTKIEDIAYCMMGIFGVNMPLTYGEGNDAFLRLQLEIIKYSNDESIFAWVDHNQRPNRDTRQGAPPESRCGLLANHPSAFSWIVHYSTRVYRSHDIPRGPFFVTNNGLQFPVQQELHRRLWLVLNCSNGKGKLAAVQITEYPQLDGVWYRTQGSTLRWIDRHDAFYEFDKNRSSIIYVCQSRHPSAPTCGLHGDPESDEFPLVNHEHKLSAIRHGTAEQRIPMKFEARR